MRPRSGHQCARPVVREGSDLPRGHASDGLGAESRLRAIEHVLDERGPHQRLHLSQRCVKSIEAGEGRQGKLDARCAARHTRCDHDELDAEKKSGRHLEQHLGGQRTC